MYLIFFVNKCSIIPKEYLWDRTNLVTCDMSRVSFWDRSHVSSQLEIRQAWDKLQKFQLIRSFQSVEFQLIEIFSIRLIFVFKFSWFLNWFDFFFNLLKLRLSSILMKIILIGLKFMDRNLWKCFCIRPAGLENKQ